MALKADCIRRVANWSTVTAAHKFDKATFDPATVRADLERRSPKMKALLDKIKELDAQDRKAHGKVFKHFIFSEVKTGGWYGAKIIGSALLAAGDLHLAYDRNLKLRADEELRKTTSQNVIVLSSTTVFDKPVGVRAKQAMFAKFNERPGNVHGDLVRFIVMDGGFKEGVDLFDIKYVHIFEPQVSAADQKQVIGRGTRTCGQRGLAFHDEHGWPLHVFVYDVLVPYGVRDFAGADTLFQSFMKYNGIDLRLLSLADELEQLAIAGSVDYELNRNIHRFYIAPAITKGGQRARPIPLNEFMRSRLPASPIRAPYFTPKPLPSVRPLPVRAQGPKAEAAISQGPPPVPTQRLGFQEMRAFVARYYSAYAWPAVKMENLCASAGGGKGSSVAVDYTPTQNFLRQWFIPENFARGMLLYHSVGTGKTCSAIATATSGFEAAGYTILWVTRSSLKSDFWKNMFDQVCSTPLRERLESIPGPEDTEGRMRLLSNAWSIRPLSYKQFTNLVSRKNAYYAAMEKRNGTEDPLRKTLLIIDEAHKLYGGSDLSAMERPNMAKLHAALMHSYRVSGAASVRVLLLTATPFTNNPLELVQLLNLLRPQEEQLPTGLEEFMKAFPVADVPGRTAFLDSIAGHISYLNREKDARQFAQPVITPVYVDMSDRRGMLTEEDIREKHAIGLKNLELDERYYKIHKKVARTPEAVAEAEAGLEKVKRERAVLKGAMHETLQRTKNNVSQLTAMEEKCEAHAPSKQKVSSLG